jgi:ABC-type glutathione transport system ATPase component
LAGAPPQILTIVGQSGSGKTTLARLILGLERPSAGRLSLLGADLARARGPAARRQFMGLVQPIFQNPFEAFNPLRQLDYYLLLTARRFGGAADRDQAAAATETALGQVGLSLAEVAGRYPHELSGGQLQRLAIARALVAKPKLIVADEPVSMVDASMRMAIVTLFKTLRETLGISIIYITHDLATAYWVSDRIMIMQSGQVVESGEARAVLNAPQHPYSRQLKEAVLVAPVTQASAGVESSKL